MATAPPTSAAELVAAVQGSVTALRAAAPGTDAGTWAHEDRHAAIATIDGAIKELTVYRGQLLLAHEKDGRWGSVRDRDFADYRSRETGAGRGAALGELQLAEGLEQMPAVADAVERGVLNL